MTRDEALKVVLDAAYSFAAEGYDTDGRILAAVAILTPEPECNRCGEHYDPEAGDHCVMCHGATS